MTSRRQLFDNGAVLALRILVVATVCGWLTGCQTPYPCNKRHVVADELQARTGTALGSGGGVRTGQVPDGLVVDDGLTADESVAISLWNNAALHESLSQLGVSTGQLFDAGLFADPQFSIFFPIGPKQLEFTTFQAIDALWLRPIRVRAAELDLCQLSQQMVQNGLDVARDVRNAHADLVLAQQRAELTNDALELLEQIAELAEKRLDAGDISELEVTTSRIEALRADANAASAVHNVKLAQQRLRTLMGLSRPAAQLKAIDDNVGISPIEADQLVAIALAMRPDLRAAELQATAAIERAELARNQFMNVDVVLDANERGRSGFEAGPGLRMTLPFFNGNRGGIAIADAQVEVANRRYTTLRDQVELEVRAAHTRLQQADEQQRLIDDRILPALKTAGELARKNYEAGGVPYFLVLQTTGQFIDARLRRLTATADLRRATAELERSVGQRLDPGEAATDAKEDAGSEAELETETEVIAGPELDSSGSESDTADETRPGSETSDDQNEERLSRRLR